jgi:hypothetical protein
MLLVFMALAALVVGACEPRRASVGTLPQRASVSPLAPRAQPSLSASAGSATSELSSPPTPVVDEPLLDESRGQQAAAAYREALKALCSTPGVSTGKNQERLIAAGFSSDAEGSVVCLASAQYQRPLASGSLFDVGADEVLLQVPSGRSVAAGEAMLVVMRRGPSGYRRAVHLASSETFEPRFRASFRTRVDELFLCARSGRQGLYSTRCGFLGRGTFSTIDAQAAAVSKDAADEIDLVDTSACGPGSSVSAGDVTSQGGRMQVTLVVEEFQRTAGPDDVPGVLCSRKQSRKLERFVIEYKVDHDGHYRRQTEIPQRVTEVLTRY